MAIPELITVFVALFVVIDPIGMTPLFVALTAGMETRRRRMIAVRACVTAFGLLTVFGLFGDAVLEFIGISMPAFRIAGGILLLLTAFDMLFERRAARRQGQAQEEDLTDDPSVFPLAMPLIAGPGAMATMVLITSDPSIDWTGMLAIHLVMGAVTAVVLILFLFAGILERVLGPTGINLVTRLFGMLLAALSIQFILDGLQEYASFLGIG